PLAFKRSTETENKSNKAIPTQKKANECAGIDKLETIRTIIKHNNAAPVLVIKRKSPLCTATQRTALQPRTTVTATKPKNNKKPMTPVSWIIANGKFDIQALR